MGRQLLHHQTWHTYAALVPLVILFWVVARKCNPAPSISRVSSQDTLVLDAPSPSLAGPAVQVNYASVYELRQLGFSYYEISMIVYFREQGFVFDSVPDLLCVSHIDADHLRSVASRLDFAHSSAPNVRERPLYRQDYHQAAASEYSRRAPRARRVPLFMADSTEMAQAGMTPVAWDTLAAFQSRAVLRGSAPIDSLASLSPEALAQFLSAHVASLRTVRTFPAEKPPVAPVSINSASEEQLQTVPGIGLKTAEAIVDYRQRLGGFVSTEQIREVWTMTEERFLSIQPHLLLDTVSVKKINVNSSNDTRMRRHPYFSPVIVGRLWQLRREGGRGKFLDEADVRKAISGQEVNPFFWHYVSFSRDEKQKK